MSPAFSSDASSGANPSEQPRSDLASADLETLLNIKVITASKFSEKLSDAPGVMTVVTSDELARFGGLTLREILARVPGLTPTTASFTDRSMVAARGDQTQINGGHILFLINGRPTREVLEGGLISDLMDAFPVNVLERIEVIKGPGSVLYGSDAFSAVVNLITKKASGNEITMTGEGGAAAAAAGSGSVFMKRGDFSLVGAGQFHQYPTWMSPVSTVYGGVGDFAIPNRAKGGYLGVDYKGLSLMSSYTDWTSGYIEGLFGIARWRRAFADAGYRWKAGSQWDMNFNVTYTRTTLDADSSIPFITRDSYEALAEWSNVVRLGARDQITFGVLYNYIQGVEDFYGTGTSVAISDSSRPGGAFYAQADHELTETIKLIGGFQANKISGISLDVVPRGGLVWTPTSRWSVKTLYSQAFRAPSLNETQLHYIPPPAIGGPSLLGNPDLRPEKISTVDAQIAYQGNRFEASVGYFYSVLTDNIILSNASTKGSYENFGKTTFDGVEAEGKYYFKKSFFITGSMAYQFNVSGGKRLEITPVPNFGAKAGVSYASANGLTVGLFDVYEGPISGYSAAINPKPSAYSILNANVNWDISKYLHAGPGQHVALVAHAENLINSAVWLPDWKDVPGDTIFANQGRTVFAGVEVSFKKD